MIQCLTPVPPGLFMAGLLEHLCSSPQPPSSQILWSVPPPPPPAPSGLFSQACLEFL